LSQMQEGTGRGLIEFLDWAGVKGVMKQATASAYRTAVVKVLEIDDADGDSLDMTTLDVEEQLTRFSRKSGSSYTPGSLNTYKTRFRNAVDMYRWWLDDPSGLRVAVRTRRADPKRSEPDGPQQSDNHVAQEQEPSPDEEGMLHYPFPLRSGSTAYLHLPRELPSADVKRMTAFLQSLAIDPPEDEDIRS
jgi:hypothetical protein